MKDLQNLIVELDLPLEVNLRFTPGVGNEVASKVLSREFLSFIASLGLTVSHVYQFSYRKDTSVVPFHVDVSRKLGDVYIQEVALNLQLRGRSVVRFSSTARRGPLRITSRRVPYIECTGEETTSTYEVTSRPFLICTRVPHSVDVLECPRTLVSLRFCERGEPLSWRRAVEIFKGVTCG